MGRLTNIWRHPIKGHGREEVERVSLTEGQTMPFDRRWAVRHAASNADGTAWQPPANFSRGSKAPGLMAINASVDEESGLVTLTHAQEGSITFDPDGDASEFLKWVSPMMPQDRSSSAEIIRIPERGVTDTDFPSVSLINLSSHKEVEQKLGRGISPKRWRGNFWVEGLEPWEEFSWIGKKVRVGTAVLEIRERIVRCMATTASTRTGIRDADTLAALHDGWSHQDFGIYCEVIQSGEVTAGDKVEVI